MWGRLVADSEELRALDGEWELQRYTWREK